MAAPAAASRSSTEDFDLGAEVARAARRRRRRRRGRAPSSARCATAATAQRCEPMELEHYPGMTEAAIEAMIDEAVRRFDIRAARVDPPRRRRSRRTEQIVLVAVTSAHRGAGVPGLRVPDGLPEDAGAVLEEGATTDAGARWVDARVADDAALARWGIAAGNAAAAPASRRTARSPRCRGRRSP